MDKETHEILAKPIKDRLDWEAIHLNQYGRRIKFLAIERRSRADTDDFLETKLPAWMDSSWMDLWVVQEPSTSSQFMRSSVSEDEVELNGPGLDETPPPQPLRRRIPSDELLRLEDLQS
ncbi:hypothetical protein P9112_005684 [Eukaryota sp. TZLM1-RC]